MVGQCLEGLSSLFLEVGAESWSSCDLDVVGILVSFRPVVWLHEGGLEFSASAGWPRIGLSGQVPGDGGWRFAVVIAERQPPLVCTPSLAHRATCPGRGQVRRSECCRAALCLHALPPHTCCIGVEGCLLTLLHLQVKSAVLKVGLWISSISIIWELVRSTNKSSGLASDLPNQTLWRLGPNNLQVILMHAKV